MNSLRKTSQRLGVSLFCVGSLLLASCAPQLIPQEPPAPLAQQFSASGEQAAPQRWWRAFDDPQLHRLIDSALASNLDLQATWDRLAQSAASARSAGAELWPQLDAEGSASRTRSESPSDASITSSFSLGAVASYELDLWGRVRASRNAAALAHLASRENLDTAAMSLTAEVANAWFELTTAQGQEQILNAQQVTTTKTLELIELQFRTGKVTLADLLQQRQLLEALTGEQAQAAARSAVARHRLALLTGQPPRNLELPTPQQLPELPPLPDTGIPAELLARRPDIRSAWYQVLSGQAQLKAARAERLPRISLSGRIESSAESIDTLFDNWFANLAGNLLAPLLDGGQRRAEVARSEAVLAESLHSYGQQVLVALREVEDALVQEQRQQQYLQSLQSQLELSRQALAQIHTRYTRGNLSFERVLDAQRSVQQLERSELEARNQLLGYRIELYRSLCGSWPLQRHAKSASAGVQGTSDERL